MELGSGALFSNVRDPRLISYTLLPVELSVVRSFDKIHLRHFAQGIFQGASEVFLKGYGTLIENGVESHLAGFNIGGRYNLTKPGWLLVPYAEASVGLAWADARHYLFNGAKRGLGENFNFNFTLAAGLRYDLNPRWYARLGAVYSHYSNGGLSEPEYANKAIDAVGPIVALGYRF